MVATLISLLILGLLILVHEAGHFVVARRVGVRILRFSIGFGPRVFTWKRGETEYTLSLIPLGGYVKMAGEHHSERTHQPGEYLAQPIGTRAAIVFAGPFVNYLLAVLTLWVVFVAGFPELRPVVGRLIEDMPAQAAQIQEGDEIVAIGEEAVRTWEEMTAIIHRSTQIPLRLHVVREGRERTITVVPQTKETKDLYGRPQTIGQIGIAPSGAVTMTRVGPLTAIGRTFAKQGEWCASMGLALWSIISGRITMKESLTGPIGIIILTSEAVYLGFTTLLYLVSLFSLSLAIFNVLPIPILDGGHLLFLGLEQLRGTPVSVTVQERAAQLSLVALTSLIILVCVNDIQRFRLVDKLIEWIR